MAYIDVICKNCGANLGRRSVPVFGVDPGFNDSRGIDHDPDCRKCNPFYDDHCTKCGNNEIHVNGKCRSCGHQHEPKLLYESGWRPYPGQLL
jgi:hypothetical protein